MSVKHVKTPVMVHSLRIGPGKGDHAHAGTISKASMAIYTKSGGPCKFEYCEDCDAFHLPGDYDLNDAQAMADAMNSGISAITNKRKSGPRIVIRQ